MTSKQIKVGCAYLDYDLHPMIVEKEMGFPPHWEGMYQVSRRGQTVNRRARDFMRPMTVSEIVQEFGGVPRG